MNGVEGLGEAVTGGLIAREVEPKAGEVDGHTHETACLNCGTGLLGSYCHRCGQHAHIHRTLGAFWHDLVHGVLHFEGKVWRTLPLLAWRPGELTRRYIEGERARFVSPMGLFLFSVFLMFATFSALGGPVHLGSGGVELTGEERAEAQRDFEQGRQESLAEGRRLRAERARLVAAGQPTLDVDLEIQSNQRELELQEALFQNSLRLIGAEEARDAEQAKAEAAREKQDEIRSDDGMIVIGGADELNGWFNEAYKKAKQNPSLLAYKLQSNGYKFSWALIPISVPFVWLLFLHRRRYRAYKLYDHTVFVTYSITFMSLGVILLTLLRPLGFPAGLAVAAMTFVPPLHMYRQLRGAYRLSRWSALWRTVALLVFASIAAALFAFLLLALGVLG